MPRGALLGNTLQLLIIWPDLEMPSKVEITFSRRFVNTAITSRTFKVHLYLNKTKTIKFKNIQKHFGIRINPECKTGKKMHKKNRISSNLCCYGDNTHRDNVGDTFAGVALVISDRDGSSFFYSLHRCWTVKLEHTTTVLSLHQHVDIPHSLVVT